MKILQFKEINISKKTYQNPPEKKYISKRHRRQDPLISASEQEFSPNIPQLLKLHIMDLMTGSTAFSQNIVFHQDFF